MTTDDTVIDDDELEAPRHTSLTELKETVLHDPETGDVISTDWCVFPPTAGLAEVCSGETPAETLRELAEWLDDNPEAIYRAGDPVEVER